MNTVFGDFTLWAQVETPSHPTFEPFIERLQPLCGVVDGVFIAEGVGGLSGLLGAVKAKELGLTPIVHIISRDKNRVAIFSDLVTMSALGLDKVVLSVGAHPTRSPVSAAKPVYDLDVFQMLQLVQDISQGRDLVGQSMGRGSTLSAGVVSNLRADLELELVSLHQKSRMGAAFVLLLPSEALDRIEQVVKEVDIPVIASVAADGRPATDMASWIETLRRTGIRGVNVVLTPGQERVTVEALSRVRRAVP